MLGGPKIQVQLRHGNIQHILPHAVVHRIGKQLPGLPSARKMGRNGLAIGHKAKRDAGKILRQQEVFLRLFSRRNSGKRVRHFVLIQRPGAIGEGVGRCPVAHPHKLYLRERIVRAVVNLERRQRMREHQRNPLRGDGRHGIEIGRGGYQNVGLRSRIFHREPGENRHGMRSGCNGEVKRSIGVERQIVHIPAPAKAVDVRMPEAMAVPGEPVSPPRLVIEGIPGLRAGRIARPLTIGLHIAIGDKADARLSVGLCHGSGVFHKGRFCIGQGKENLSLPRNLGKGLPHAGQREKRQNGHPYEHPSVNHGRV